MEKPEIISPYEFFKRFPDEDAARKYFESKRWKDSVNCPHCWSISVAECKVPMPYRCRDCRKHFSVRTGTVLEESRLPLHKWLMAIYMLTTARKGIPSTQMAKELGVTQKTAWFLAQRIRETWMQATNASGGGGDMGPTVEIDETFIGGKEKNKHASKKLNAGRGTTGKQPVIGIKERNGLVRAFMINGTDRKELHEAIAKHVKSGSTVYTDCHSSYSGLDGYQHEAVKHSVGEYVRDQAHTNGVESFWALLKRGYYGIYHYMSPKHLNRYINEFSFRHNTASVGTMDFMEKTIEKMINCRITYKDLTNG